MDGRHVFAQYGPIERRPIVTNRFTEGRKRTEQKETKEISTEVSEGSKGDIRKVAGRCCPTRRGGSQILRSFVRIGVLFSQTSGREVFQQKLSEETNVILSKVDACCNRYTGRAAARVLVLPSPVNPARLCP